MICKFVSIIKFMLFKKKYLILFYLYLIRRLAFNLEYRRRESSERNNYLLSGVHNFHPSSDPPVRDFSAKTGANVCRMNLIANCILH